jgi:ATP-dependent Lon protease
MQSEYVMDALDSKLNKALDGKVVRKDLLHRIKKGTNVDHHA